MVYATGVRPVTATKVPMVAANGSKDARARKGYVPATLLEQAFDVRDRHRERLVRAGAMALAVSLFALFPGFVAPVLAVTCPDNGSLTDGAVSPSSGTTNTNFHFTVVYQDNAGETPASIRVFFNGANGRQLNLESGTLQTGATYGRTRTRPAGTWTITFVVDPGTDGVTTTCSVSGGTITVTNPPTPTPVPTPTPTPTPTPKPTPVPTPKPTPKPTPTPTPRPTPRPTPKPTPRPTPTPARATPKPTPKATPKATPEGGAKATRTQKPTTKPTPKTAVGSPSPSSSGVGSVTGASPSPTLTADLPVPTRSPAAGAGVTSAAGGSGGSDGDAGTGLGAVLGMVTNPNPFLAWIIASAGGILLFLVLMRRAKEQEEASGGSFLLAAPLAGPVADALPAPVLAAVSAAPEPPAVGAKPRSRKVVTPPPPPETSKQPTPTKAAKPSTEGNGNGKRATKGVTPAAPVTAAAEVAIPVAPASVGVASWAASDMTRATARTRTEPRTFSKPPGKGVERLKVGYRMVRLSEGVDDVSSRELDRLDRGDEVEVVDSFEGFLQVKTPEGLTGWIPRHTILGSGHVSAAPPRPPAAACLSEMRIWHE